MSLALVVALTLSPTATAGHCSWDSPGVDPFMGRVPAAVDRYTDIPADVRERLKARMTKRQYDEMATIRRDSITGKFKYSSEIRDMHFGQGRVCNTVSRSKWAPEAVERGLVYCEAEHCIIVPTVCRNVSRVTRLPGPGTEAPGGPKAEAPDGKAVPLAAADAAGPGELVFDPPGAGETFSEASQPLAATDPLIGGGAIGVPGAGVPLTTTLGGLPIFGGGSPGFPAGAESEGGIASPPSGGGFSGPGGGSGLEVPIGVMPVGGGSIGGGGGGFSPVVPQPIDVPINVPIATAPPIPEPATWLMWLAGLVGLGALVRRRNS